MLRPSVKPGAHEEAARRIELRRRFIRPAVGGLIEQRDAVTQIIAGQKWAWNTLVLADDAIVAERYGIELGDLFIYEGYGVQQEIVENGMRFATASFRQVHCYVYRPSDAVVDLSRITFRPMVFVIDIGLALDDLPWQLLEMLDELTDTDQPYVWILVEP